MVESMDAIISIKPKYAEMIFNGEKDCGLRRVVPKKEVDKYYIYASSPICKVVGYFTVYYTMSCDTVEELYEHVLTCDLSTGITCEEFVQYFNGSKECGLLFIRKVVGIEHKTLNDFGIKRAPQNYCYTKGE